MKESRIKGKIARLCASPLIPEMALIVTLMICGPINNYFAFAEKENFAFTVHEFFPDLLVTGLLVLACIVIVTLLLPESKYAEIAGLFLGVALAAYIEGTYIRADYGLLDGHYIIWGDYGLHGLIDTIIWTVIIFFCKWMSRKTNFERYIQVISGGLILIQIITTGYFLATFQMDFNPYLPTFRGFLDYSSKKNVVVIVLDSFDQKTMSKLLEEKPEYRQQLPGFTYYPDTIGSFSHTTCAIPHILTGIPYDNTVDYETYINNVWQESNITKVWKDKNYIVSLYTDGPFLGKSLYGEVDNYEAVSYPVEVILKFLYKITAYTYSPHFLRPFTWIVPAEEISGLSEAIIYNYSNSSIVPRILNKEIYITTDRPVFKFYHFQGPHPLWEMSRNLEFIEGVATSEEEQAEGSLKMAMELIHMMKEKSIFDNSAIVIMADHGYHDMNENPILLIKRPGKEADFIISDKPLSYYSNLEPSLISLVSDNTITGSAWALNNNEDGVRYFRDYTWALARNNFEGYMPDIIEYSTEKQADQYDAYQQTGIVYSSSNLPKEFYEQYSYGDYIGLQFSIDNGCPGRDYFERGFTLAENGSWIGADGASLVLRLEKKPSTDLVFKFASQDVAEDGQLVRYFANGHYLTEGVITGGKQATSLIIPKEFFSDDTLQMKFELPGNNENADSESKELLLVGGFSIVRMD